MAQNYPWKTKIQKVRKQKTLQMKLKFNFYENISKNIFLVLQQHPKSSPKGQKKVKMTSKHN